MKLSTSFLALAASLTTPALAAVGGYGQCGGIGYSGDTSCVSGFTCTYSNDWYSQCVPGSAGSTTASSSTTKSTTTTTSTSTTATSTTATSTTSTSAPPSSTGFVKTSGQKFTLNGKTFTLVGSNSYWVGLQGLTTAQMNQAFADIAKTGATTVRTWGFNDVTATSGWAYYQLWNGKTATVNTGPLGLANFDNVVAAAKANGLRLIVALTNNWSDYGGMDVYTKQITGSANHDVFYTDSNVQAAYKSYISTFVGRYKNEPTILAWELANEPRCKGSSGISSGTCTTSTVTSWIKSASAYIKSIDSNHLVAVGDEGFFNQPGAPTYPYQGSEGIDFTANLAVSTIDFGTFHMYPEPWGQSANVTGWGTQWIIDHASAQKAANKPVILEEFGAKSDQAATYTTWLNTVVSSGLTGDLIWQAGSKLSGYTSPDDGYAVYPDGAVYPVVTKHAAALKARG